MCEGVSGCMCECEECRVIVLGCEGVVWGACVSVRDVGWMCA